MAIKNKKQPYKVSRYYWPTKKTFQPNGKREATRRLDQIINGELEFWHGEYHCICKWRMVEGRWHLAAKPYAKIGKMFTKKGGKMFVSNGEYK
jgi:hypothetical protein